MRPVSPPDFDRLFPPTVFLSGFVDADLEAAIAWRTEVSELMKVRGVVPVWPPGLKPRMSAEQLERARRYAAENPCAVMADCFQALMRADSVFVRLCPLLGDGTRCELLGARKVGKPVVGWAVPPVSYEPVGLDVYGSAEAAVRAIVAQRHICC